MTSFHEGINKDCFLQAVVKNVQKTASTTTMQPMMQFYRPGPIKLTSHICNSSQDWALTCFSQEAVAPRSSADSSDSAGRSKAADCAITPERKQKGCQQIPIDDLRGRFSRMGLLTELCL